MSTMTFWRKRSKKFAAHLVFWPIIAVFVIWGFERYGNSAGGSAAVVNGHSITMREYNRAMQRMIDFYTQMTGGQFDEQAQRRYHIRETALQQLVNSELMAQEAEKMGLKVTDQELAEMITTLPYLKKDGKFSKENYEAILKYNHMTPNQFETGLRKETLVEKARKVFEKNVLTGSLEKEKQALLESQKINLEYIKFGSEKIADSIIVSSQDIERFKSNQDYAAKVKEYYDLNSREFNISEQIKAQHILVKAQKSNAKEEEQAFEKIKKIQSELKKSSFADLAKKYSDDPGSKAKGGELGWFEKGRMVPEFESAAFGLKVGEVSKPIQTQFGFHIIKVEDKKKAKNVSLEAATSEIIKKLISLEKADQAIREIQNLLASNPDSGLKKIKDLDKNAKWQETGFFSLQEDVIPQVGGGDEAMREALSLTEAQPQSKKLFSIAGQYVVLRLKKIEKNVKPNELAKKAQAPQESSASRELFTAWASKLSEKAKVQVNPKLFSGDFESSGDM